MKQELVDLGLRQVFEVVEGEPVEGSAEDLEHIQIQLEVFHQSEGGQLVADEVDLPVYDT